MLLRPEFAQKRKLAIEKRASTTQINHVVIAMGGTDPNNVSAEILQVVNAQKMLPKNCKISILIGQTSPNITTLQNLASNSLYETEVVINPSSIADILINADLCIGAAGSMTWERCCLGLPSILIAIADNQLKALQLLAENDICEVLSRENIPSLLTHAINQIKLKYPLYITNCLNVTDGLGANTCIEKIENIASQ